MIRNGLLVVACFGFLNAYSQVDTDVTTKTSLLYNNLKAIQNSDYFLFGQEFFNSFRYNSGSAHGEETFSDVNAVTGAYPVVLGSDFHYYLDKNDTERGYHTDAVKWAYQKGFAITFDWHLSARNTSSYTCDGSPASLAKNIANGNTNGDRDWYLSELDKVISIINDDLVVGDERIPIVFRPLHEMNGNWFWWGAACSGFAAADYKKLYQLTVDYMKERTNSVLFCWSPNSPVNNTVMANYYPGDAYVDVLGLDIYELTADPFRQYMGVIVDHAQAHDKVAVLSETGYRNDTGNGETAARYWNDTVLPAIVNDPSSKSIKIAWALTWINSSWSHPYVPHAGSTSTAKQSFINFKNSEHVRFSDKMSSIYDPLVIVSVNDELSAGTANVALSHDQHSIIVSLTEFNHPPTSMTVYDLTGRKIIEENVQDSRSTFSIGTSSLKSGIYVVKVSDSTKMITQKVYVP